MTSKLPSDIPGEVRISDQTVEPMRTLIDGYAQFVRFGVPGDFITRSDLNIKLLSYVEENAASAFAFARKLLEVRDPQALFRLQAEFIQEQLHAMAGQMQDIGTAATSLMGPANKETRKNGPSS